MKKPWTNDNCEAVKAYFGYYSVPQAALLWCGVPPDQVDEELALAVPVGENNSLVRAVLKHPYIPCLEPRCRVIHDAIDNNLLPAGRDGGKVFLKDECGHIAYDRRTLNRESLKEWIAKTFPNDKPAFLFDDIERTTHSAINADTFRALQADRDALKARIEKATEAYRSLKQEYDKAVNERDLLRVKVKKMPVPSERAEVTYLNIIGGLLGLMLGKSPAGKQHSIFNNQAAIISSLLAHYENKPGIASRTLEDKFAAAKRSLNET